MQVERSGEGELDKASDKNELVICHGSPIPPGYVVTGEKIDSSCPRGKAHVVSKITLRVPASDSEHDRALEWVTLPLDSPKVLDWTISFRDRMSPVQHQKYGPNCTAFAITACLELFHGKLHLSESHLNHLVAERTSACLPGISLRDAMYEVWRLSGIVSATDLPYNPDVTCFKPLPDLAGRATYKFEHANIVMLNSDSEVLETIARGSTGVESPRLLGKVDNVRRVLSTYQFPVALDVPVFKDSLGNFLCNWKEGPDISMPAAFEQASWLEHTNSGEGGEGWHAIAICGYDDSTRRLLFKNSWGEGWGDGGYGTIPYDYVERFSRISVAGWNGPPPY